MRITLTIPDPIVERFHVFVPPKERSRLVTELIERELKKIENRLESACLSANKDKKLDCEIDEWQNFDELLDE